MKTTAVGLVLGCWTSLLWPTHPEAPVRNDGRVFEDVTWHEVGGVPPTLASPIELPVRIVGWGDTVAVFDFSTQSLKGIDLAGQLLWEFGRRGQGPSEFQQVRRLTLGPVGHVWITDSGNRRLVKVSRTGELVENVLLPPQCMGAVPLSDGMFCLSDSSDAFAHQLTSEGEVVATLTNPPQVEGVHQLVKEGEPTWIPGPSPRAVVAFRYSGILVEARPNGGRTSVSEHAGVEDLPFPEVLSWRLASGNIVTRADPAASPGAENVGAAGNEVYVLFHGTSEEAGRIVDVYRSDDLIYVRSLLLPEVVMDLAWLSPTRVAAIIQEPIPHIKVWEIERP